MVATGRKRRGPMTEEQRAAAALRAKEGERRIAAALARMPDLPPDQMSEDGCINLVKAFWEDARHDLACGNTATRDPLAGGAGFVVWCDIGHIDPDDLRAFLLKKVWRNTEYRRLNRYLGRDDMQEV